MAVQYTTERNVIKIVDEKIKDGAGTRVVANPPISGTETKLSGLKVEEDVYRTVGTQMYRHYFEVPEMSNTTFTIINDVSTPYTDLVEQDLIFDGKFSTPGRHQKIVGIVYTPNGHKLCVLDYSQSGPIMQILSNVELTGLVDTVIEL